MNAFVSSMMALLLVASALASEPKAADELSRQQIVRIWEKSNVAWEKGDIDAMVEMCAEDVEYVNGRPGLWWRGKEQLKQGWKMERSFGSLPTRLVEQRFRLISPVTAVLISRLSTSVPATKEHPAIADAQGIMSWLFVKRGGRWLMVSGQTTMVSEQTPPKL